MSMLKELPVKRKNKLFCPSPSNKLEFTINWKTAEVRLPVPSIIETQRPRA